PATTTPSVPEWIYKNGEWVERQPTPSAAEQAPPTRQDRQELIETMTGRADSQAPPTATAAAPVPATPSQPRWIYYNGKWIETTTPTGEPVQTTTSKPEQAPDRPTQPSIDWGQIAGVEEEHRVIKISADSLRKGDPRHNIVVRAGDAIRLASGEFGEYYLMGQVMRPGAYSLTGRIITLKTAIASAGNLGQLAWPTHCTVYRRLGEREQMIQVNLDAIFTGKEQDFFIKKDDLILVGTHPVATFLAVLRNAFRISYGFGFVYDRNFADMDSYTSRPNPAYQQRQYPNLFR
ncbi:MAG: hypothetical protein KAV82_09470, partial [Phycisphaerae bacterium]|nr:hypothetical protein [Phycisphaerae bacterium]